MNIRRIGLGGRIWAIAVLTTAALALVVPANLAQASPGNDVSAADTVGTLLSLKSSTSAVPIPGSVQRMSYFSRTSANRSILVTGDLFLPSAPWTGPGERRLISYAYGTQGQGDQCAPSVSGRTSPLAENVLIGALMNAGYAVVATDYQGLGTPELHSYTDRVASGRAVLDAARAALASGRGGLTRKSRVALYGYSQGGGAVAAAAELAKSYAPELSIVGTVAGAPVVDLVATAKAMDGGPAMGDIGYMFNSLISRHPKLAAQKRRDLNSRGLAFLKAVAVQCDKDTESAFGGTDSRTLTTDGRSMADLLNSVPWVHWVERERIGNVAPKAPVLVVSAAHDDTVPTAASVALVRSWRLLGGKVGYSEVGIPHLGFGADHAATAVPTVPLGLSWLGDRFNEPEMPRS
ncbi:alpha/beta fold hydrolase [Gordonia sp. CPCC 205333]|uniref:alpha/beta fold hydrolase n=1 Tax=Gordonia sp. CPCC 205333 TaxID=3140790 RepID=UPI003AF3F838